ncbi:MAG: Hpt domain-containing protein [Spirochaetales bacterium]|jgi:HPt (histidine-containing phosphotransfer) domain-containing protein|nr:Hpt domain-containing protein [Spirochaetales bacterium]
MGGEIADAIIDLEEGLGRVRGNRKLYGKMLGMFLKGQEFDALEAALKAGDNSQAGDLAHTIKGITGNLSLTALFKASTQLMNEFRAGQAAEESLANYREILVKTKAEVEALIAQLASEG